MLLHNVLSIWIVKVAWSGHFTEHFTKDFFIPYTTQVIRCCLLHYSPKTILPTTAAHGQYNKSCNLIIATVGRLRKSNTSDKHDNLGREEIVFLR